MKRVKTLILLFAALGAYAGGEPPAHSSFEAFRQGLLQSYSSFRDGVLKDYAKFLEDAWSEYETFKGEKRDATPKPEVAPSVPGQNTAEVPATSPPAVVEPTTPPPTTTPATIPSNETPVNEAPVYHFDYYGIDMEVPDIDVKISDRLATTADYARQWRDLSAAEQATTLTDVLGALATKHNLNGYLTFDLARHYVNARYGDAHSSSRASLLHYILANMGFDVRPATTGNNTGLLLLHFDSKVYGIPYLDIDGKRYHVFAEEALEPGAHIFTCTLPGNAPQGEAVGLKLTQLNIPVDEKKFEFSYEGLHIEGTVNANLFPIIYRYPQMEISRYAQSTLDADLRQDIVRQIREQLQSESTIGAINRLLQFTQHAFQYATDEQAHGFEKPYFFEEVLYYPRCDCEDRVIFYSYLLWNVLGVENQLITYPGHESAAVRLTEPVDGDCYTYGGNRFYISDPTYIGSVTGQCMPVYRHNKPEIDYHYKK